MDINEQEWMRRQAQWERLLNILDEADAIQQKLLGDDDEVACYEFHNQLTRLAEEFEEFASADEKSWLESEEEVDRTL